MALIIIPIHLKNAVFLYSYNTCTKTRNKMLWVINTNVFFPANLTRRSNNRFSVSLSKAEVVHPKAEYFLNVTMPEQ